MENCDFTSFILPLENKELGYLFLQNNFNKFKEITGYCARGPVN